MRPAASLLLLEADALLPILRAVPDAAFDRPTNCPGWSVRDVLAHCSAALTRTAAGDLHSFSPADNQRDVDERRPWPLDDVLSELSSGYQDAAAVIDAADGALDAIGLGEWVHGGDVREAVGAPGAYASEGVELAIELLAERSARMSKPPLTVHVAGRELAFGAPGEPGGLLRTDAATFVRLCSGRPADPTGYELMGAEPADLVLFS